MRKAGSRMRVDKNTGKRYTEHNMPLDKCIHMVIPKVAQFKILNENYGHESDVWYDGIFCGDRYAVFKYNLESHYWQQITPWYKRFGYAQGKMFEAYNKLFYESEVK